MESKFKKENVAARANDSDHNDWQHAEIILALIEIGETIEEAFARLDQTHTEAFLMLVGCKETFDGYVASRLKADKVLAGVMATMLAKPPENGEKPAGPADEPKKSAVTLDVGGFGKPGGGSGIA